MLHAKNDAQRIKNELKDLKSKNEPLLDLIIDLYHYVDNQFDKDVIITMIAREQAEQDTIYKDTYRGSRAYNDDPWKSPHQVWTAIDIRSSIYTDSEIKKIEEYLNMKYNNSNYYKVTAMYHEVTTADGRKLGKHFHINYATK